MEQNDQYIIVIFKDPEKLPMLISHALLLASGLQKGITFLYVNSSSDENTSQLFISRLDKIFQGNLNGLKAHVIPVLDQNLIQILPAKFGGVMILTETDDYTDKKSVWSIPRMMKLLRHSRLPYILVRNELENKNHYRKIILPMDAMKESKEKVLWASYFGRFLGSEIQIVSKIYKDEFLARQSGINVKFVKKIFDSFDLQYNVHTFVDKIPNLDEFSVDYASKTGAGLVVAMTTPNISWINLLWGIPENKLAANSFKIPVLFLNSRDDLYILCD